MIAKRALNCERCRAAIAMLIATEDGSEWHCVHCGAVDYGAANVGRGTLRGRAEPELAAQIRSWAAAVGLTGWDANDVEITVSSSADGVGVSVAGDADGADDFAERWRRAFELLETAAV